MKLLRGLPYDLFIFSLALLMLCNGTFSNNTSVMTNVTSLADPFRQLRLHADLKPREPICCLIPLTTEPLPTTAEFLSFEEWKSKQRELQAQAQATNQTSSPSTSASDFPGRASVIAPPMISGDADLALPTLLEPAPSPSPHFRVPLTDRFNYASLDCSARVHTSHDSARFPAAILSSKKDRYMLSPCSADPNFVIVELCDDIRIDTVQLANFEFFSGVFRDFRVSVAQTYTSDGQGWIEAGAYQAKNIRSVQSFHPLVELRPFYRYIRIDFLSHYGSEFYCPISLLRVYGLTQMEEWKWEVWQSGSENQGVQIRPGVEGAGKAYDGFFGEDGSRKVDTQTENETDGPTTQEVVSNTVQSRTLYKANDAVSIPESHALKTAIRELQATKSSWSSKSTILEFSPISSPQRATPQSVVTESTVLVTTIPTIMTGGDAQTNSAISPSTPPAFTPNNAYSSSNPSNATFPSPSSSIQAVTPTALSSPNTSGESIYRTIMNRLAMLETNTTLYQKYVEEQTLQIREALRRLEEEVGRLEGISKAQQSVFLKAIQELEMRRRQLDKERGELLTKVNDLTEEVTLEKRLGIAQLCLLLTVLIFMALTRGSRTSLLDVHKPNSFGYSRTWTSAGWSRKRWISRSRSPIIDYAIVKKEPKEEDREATMTSLTQPKDLNPLALFPTTPPAGSQTPRSFVHRPSTPRHQDMSRLVGEGRPAGRLRRSNSHNTPVNVVLSAKRFARTAHLHEIQLANRDRGVTDEDNTRCGPNENAQTLIDGSPKPRRRANEPPSTPMLLGHSTSRGEESEAWVDTEAGSDSTPASNDADSEEGSTVQEVESTNDQTVPMISLAPSKRRRRLDGHVPPSPAPVFT